MQTAAASAASFSTYDCYAHSRIPAPQRQDRSHAFRHGRRCRAVPFRCRRGRHVGTHGDARTHIPHAICHLLPRAAARDAPVNAARMAACHTDCRMRSHIPRTAAVQSGRSSGSHDMHTRPRSNGHVVIAGMLGANVATMATYSLLCNMAVAVIAPVVLSFTGNGECTFAQLLARIAPLLIMPFAAAQFCRLVLPRAAGWVGDHGQISFYMWLLSLAFIIGRTTCFLLDHNEADRREEIALAAVALIICLAQFSIGRRLGRRYGDVVAGGQSLGQKNTVLAVWMSQAFLDPISSVAPTAYIVWQNFVNSYQIYRKDRQKARQQAQQQA